MFLPPQSAAAIDSDWPDEEPEQRSDSIDGIFDDADEDAPLELDVDDWDALDFDDEYEPEPGYGDFWTEVDDE